MDPSARTGGRLGFAFGSFSFSTGTIRLLGQDVVWDLVSLVSHYTIKGSQGGKILAFPSKLYKA